MSIPYELREKIYVNVFEEAELFGHVPGGDEEAGFGRTMFWSLNMNVNVLRVSIQVHNEALPLLKTAVHLKIYDHRVSLAYIPWRILRYLPHIERLTLYTGRPTFDHSPRPYHGFDASCLPKLKFLTVSDKKRRPDLPEACLAGDSALNEHVDTLFSKLEKDYIETWVDECCHPQTDGLSWLSTMLTSPSPAQLMIEVRIDCYYFQRVCVQGPGAQWHDVEGFVRIVFDFKTRKVLSRSLQGIAQRCIIKETHTSAAGDTKEQVLEWLLNPEA